MKRNDSHPNGRDTFAIEWTDTFTTHFFTNSHPTHYLWTSLHVRMKQTCTKVFPNKYKTCSRQVLKLSDSSTTFGSKMYNIGMKDVLPLLYCILSSVHRIQSFQSLSQTPWQKAIAAEGRFLHPASGAFWEGGVLSALSALGIHKSIVYWLCLLCIQLIVTRHIGWIL